MLFRSDTTPLEHVARPALTCTELEDYFGTAIAEGRSNKDYDAIDVASASTAHSWKKNEFNPHRAITPKVKHIKIDDNKLNNQSVQEGSNEDDDVDAQPPIYSGENATLPDTNTLETRSTDIPAVDGVAAEPICDATIPNLIQVKEPAPIQFEPIDGTPEMNPPASPENRALPDDGKKDGASSAQTG